MLSSFTNATINMDRLGRLGRGMAPSAIACVATNVAKPGPGKAHVHPLCCFFWTKLQVESQSSGGCSRQTPRSCHLRVDAGRRRRHTVTVAGIAARVWAASASGPSRRAPPWGATAGAACPASPRRPASGSIRDSESHASRQRRARPGAAATVTPAPDAAE